MRIAAAQINVYLADAGANTESINQWLGKASDHSARLVIFPECAVSGYCYSDRDEAMAHAESLEGPAVRTIIERCRKLELAAVFGMLEKTGDKLFNTSVLVNADGIVGVYRKVHLPYLGVDRFTDFGEEPFAVHAVGDFSIGMNICYDLSFPEASRTLALQGADLIALPTNWPPGAESVARYTVNSRAMENGVYVAAVNRVGEERGFQFIGQSRICDPLGQTLMSADHQEECLLIADIDLAMARRKTVVRVPQQHVIDRFADRRPEFYGELLDPHNLPRPGRDKPA